MRLISFQSSAFTLLTELPSTLKTPSTSIASNPRRASHQQLQQLLAQISLKWPSLLRSNLSLIDLLYDPKLPSASQLSSPPTASSKLGTTKPFIPQLPHQHQPPPPPPLLDQKFKLYVRSTSESGDNLHAIKSRLLHENPLGDLDHVEILELPPNRLISKLDDHGTLYLPYPYVVPGGRFQEMYAWDSFFIALGLLRDNQVRLARNIVDNYIYQIEHYGTILNGNRTYYLTRSQLPFLTPLIKLVLPTISADQDRRQVWLRRAIKAAEKYHRYWTTGPHRTGTTGLSRFFDFGPPGSSPPEIIHERDPRDGSSAHDRVKKFFRQHYHDGIPDYDISKYYNYEKDELTAKFMDNDRAMRESGFDTSRRFGPFNSKILDFNPVCLNSLIYLMEKEIGELYAHLEPEPFDPVSSSSNQHQHHRTNTTTTTTTRSSTATASGGRITRKLIKSQSRLWCRRAQDRRSLINKFNWDEQLGLYFDYDYVRGERRIYRFGTTFIPLWTGLATQEQAERVCREGLKALELPGGLSTSDRLEGDQWDKPYIWAPLQLFAVDGLRKYGFHPQADRLAANFDSMVLKTWLQTGRLWEKYDGIKRDESVDLKFGYPTNEEGFGWTNALFTRFYDHLKSVGKQDDILLFDGVSIDRPAGAEDDPQGEQEEERVLGDSEQSKQQEVIVASVGDRLESTDAVDHPLPPPVNDAHDDGLHRFQDLELDDWIEVGLDHPRALS